ncbi:phospholipase D/nuclease [Laetiporus sulphureus 93-53]|uniref:Phospholipase D/nuclease n=1 Tax=Laetiporus sulphureus 93-53 TaxID=1314785 RepID=A0A165HW33_9APHY|nr:phospholipase D/nuclease [Laetiporus sulphureus 93-53]KZT12269.1 phospholipase D/nuclease [Laetiporus sulphureus 93-53]
MVSERVYNLTHSEKTLTAAYAASPDSSPGELVKKVYEAHHHGVHEPGTTGGIFATAKSMLKTGKTPEESRKVTREDEPSKEDLDRAAECGEFGARPSDLFLKIYHDVLKTLDVDPWAGSVSPPLLGSRGAVSFTIISVIPDIIQHHYDCIIKAEHEVFLATNFWQASKSASKICAGFIELSRRAEVRGKKVVVKMMYDRANLKMLTESHLYVKEDEWVKDEVKLPRRSEMPWVDFELVNFHQPVLGTFHSKFMIVDRKMALLCSNNIQDRPNFEMMCHLEGPIVDSMYDMALVSWHRVMHPPLPLLGRPCTTPEEGYKFGMENEYATTHLLDGKKGEEIYKQMVAEGKVAHDQDEAATSEENKGEPGEVKPFISGKYQTITDHINAGDQSMLATVTYDPITDEEYTPHILHAPHAEVPMALVNRPPYGRPGNDERELLNPQASAWLAALKHAQKRVFIQTPTFSAPPVVEGVLSAVRRGIEVILYVDVGFNDGGEVLPYQGGANEVVVREMYAQLAEEEKERLKYYWYTARDQVKPINAHLQQRNCHVKLMVVDDTVGIMGNGNQDVQSWYHSQEVNVMIDSPHICAEWLDAVDRVQNTHLHRVGLDGVYRDAQGVELPDSTGLTKGVRGVIRGIQGSIARVQGKGGF